MPPPRHPSRMASVNFPVFAMSWYADPGDGTQILAYGGGGGSAKTGVNNNIVWSANNDIPGQISTGEEVTIALKAYAVVMTNPENKRRFRQFYLLAGMGNKVRRYRLPQEDCMGEIDVGEMVSAIAVNNSATLLAVGCDSGIIKVYPLKIDYPGIGPEPLSVLQHHTKSVSALDFSARNHRLVASGKDGTASVWHQGRLVDTLNCIVPGAKKGAQILVRGCAFADLLGQLVLTVSSARKGKAFLSQWAAEPEEKKPQSQGLVAPGKFRLAEQTVCSEHPISAMSLSLDGGLIALGSVDGSVILWGVQEWKVLKKFVEVHDLPVMCIAARPYAVPMLRGEEEDGITVHARSASADSQLGILTWQRRAPKKKSPGGSDSEFDLMQWIHRLIVLCVISLVLHPAAMEAHKRCRPVYKDEGIMAVPACLRYKFLLAPPDMPGVSRPPY